jgi:hypothetical protein
MWGAIRFLAGIILIAASFIAQNAMSACATEVDLLLALAADVSGSVDDQKFALQREGYSAAITSPRVIEAIRSGGLGRIAVCYIEWSGLGNQKVLIDWTVIQDAASAHRFAGQLDQAPRAFFGHTSVSGGIDFAMRQIKRARFGAKRRVIDVSGDGDDDNSGGDVTLVRDKVLAEGITINALVVSEDQPLVWEDGSVYPGDDLERYYREKIIGGPSAFVMVARDHPSFGQALITKMVAEIASLPITHASVNATKESQTVRAGSTRSKTAVKLPH